jgi:hypothetical protein
VPRTLPKLVSAPLASLLLLAACAAPDLSVDPRLELGTGLTRFEPLVDGEAVPIVFGVQGGHHIWGGVRAIGLDWRDLEVEFRLRDELNEEIVSEPIRVPLRLRPCDLEVKGCTVGMGEVLGITVLVDELGAVEDRRTVMEAEAWDRDQRTALDRVFLRPFYE